MRLLIVNPNTSKGVTDRIREAANNAAQPGDHFATICPSFGPQLIVTPQDAELASRAVVEAVKAYEAPCDGIVLASFGDTGAEGVRALRPDLPVIGIATAAFAVVSALGGPFGIVTFGRSLVPGLMDKAKEAGVDGQLIGTEALRVDDFGYPGTVQSRHKLELSQLCVEMQQRGATSIVMGGGPLAGLASKIGASCPVPLIDGTQCAINIMRTTARSKKGHDAFL